MTPEELQAAAIDIYGKKNWRGKLAADIGKNYQTVYRWSHDVGKRGIPKYVDTFLDARLQQRKMKAMAKRMQSRLAKL